MLKLLTASDGKIPFIPMAIALLVGAFAMFLYAKIYKPKILFQNIDLPSALPSPPSRDPTTSAVPSGIPVPVESTTAAQPTFIGIRDIAPHQPNIQMPKLPAYHPQEDDTEDDEEDDDEDDLEQDARRRRN